MEEEELSQNCFLCEKPNCSLKCPAANCDIYFCSEDHYYMHSISTTIAKPLSEKSKAANLNATKNSVVGDVKDTPNKVRKSSATEATESNSSSTHQNGTMMNANEENDENANIITNIRSACHTRLLQIHAWAGISLQ